MPGCGAGVGSQQEDVGAAGARGEHHALGRAEAHLARLEVRDDHGEAADELLGRVGLADAGEHRAPLAAEVHGEPAAACPRLRPCSAVTMRAIRRSISAKSSIEILGGVGTVRRGAGRLPGP